MDESSFSAGAKRILLLTPDYPRPGQCAFGGVGGACYSLAQALRPYQDLHVKVMEFCNRPEVERPEINEAIEDGIAVVRVALPGTGRAVSRLVYRQSQLIRQLIDAVPHDLLHAQGCERIVADCNSQCKLLTVHGIAERDTLYRRPLVLSGFRYLALRALHGQARRCIPNLVVINPYVRDIVGASTGQRVWDVPNAVHESFFRAARVPQPGRVVLVGRVVARKNVVGAIRAFRQITALYPRAVLHVVGAGDARYVARCMSLTRSLGLESCVRFLGPLPPALVQRELAQAQIALMSSRQETAPMFISEAMASGVPVVASSVGGVRHMVSDGVTGVVVRSPTVESLSEAVCGLLSDSDKLHLMSINARRMAEALYHPDVVGSKTRDIYIQLLSR